MSLPPLKGDKPKKKKKVGNGHSCCEKEAGRENYETAASEQGPIRATPKEEKTQQHPKSFFSYSLLRDLGRRSECIWPPPFPSYRLIDRIR